MSWLDWCKKELELIGAFDNEKDFYGGLVGKAVMELCEIFDKQNHSAMSASLVGSLFDRLRKGLPLSELTGDETEWKKIGDDTYQNIRYSSVFKKNGVAYDLNYYAFMDENGGYYMHSASRKYIKFPYYPEQENKKLNINHLEFLKNKFLKYFGKMVEGFTFDGRGFIGTVNKIKLEHNDLVLEIDEVEVSGSNIAFIKEI